MANHKAAKAKRQGFDRQLNAGVGALEAPQPINNEALIARSRGFRYGVPVALLSEPTVQIGKVERLASNNPNVPGACRVVVLTNAGRRQLKPSEIVRYVAQS